MRKPADEFRLNPVNQTDLAPRLLWQHHPLNFLGIWLQMLLVVCLGLIPRKGTGPKAASECVSEAVAGLLRPKGFGAYTLLLEAPMVAEASSLLPEASALLVTEALVGTTSPA